MVDPYSLLFGIGAGFIIAAILVSFGVNDCDDCLFNENGRYAAEYKSESAVDGPPQPEMSPADKETRGIFEDAFGRYKLGESRYGVFDKDTDPRDFLLEGEEELLDLMVYANFEIARIRALKKRIRSVLDAPYPSPWGMP